MGVDNVSCTKCSSRKRSSDNEYIVTSAGYRNFLVKNLKTLTVF